MVLNANTVAESLSVDWLSNVPWVSISSTATWKIQHMRTPSLAAWCHGKPVCGMYGLLHLSTVRFVHQEDLAPDLNPSGLPLWAPSPGKTSQRLVTVSQPVFWCLRRQCPQISLEIFPIVVAKPKLQCSFDDVKVHEKGEAPPPGEGIPSAPQHSPACTCNAAWSPWEKTCPCGRLQPRTRPPPPGLWLPRPGGCGSAPPRPAQTCGHPWPAAPARVGHVHRAPPPPSSSRHFCRWGTLEVNNRIKFDST